MTDTIDSLERSPYPLLKADLTTPGQALTMEMMEAFIEATMNAGPPPLHRHMVNSTALARGGWTICGDCLGPVYLGEPRG